MRWIAPVLVFILCVGTGTASATEKIPVYDARRKETLSLERVTKPEARWRKELPPAVYKIMRQEGTERAFSGNLTNNKASGLYVCAACGTHLFSSDTKYDSRTGWPSFWDPVSPHNVGTKTDTRFLMTRTEVHCARCGSHLGHIFDDGPPPTGKRYCINSLALKFIEG